MHRSHRPTDPAVQPPGPDLRVGPFRAEQLPRVGALFAASHADYPPFRHLFPDPARRSAVLRAFFTSTVRDALAVGTVDAATGGDGQLLGVAVWLPPGAFPWNARRKLRSLPMLLSVLRTAPGGFPGFVRLGANAERLHPHDRHWNLETMGITPAAQGQGIGRRLLAPGLGRADTQRLACYLTTAKAENLAFYRRFGFEVEAGELQLVPGGPPHWAMRRPPAPVGEGGELL